MAISGFIGVALLPRITGGRHRLRPMPATAHAAVRYSLVNYLSTLAYQAPYFALPVIVLVNVDAATNSSFYVAWGIVAIAFYVPSAIGQALLAEGGKDGAKLRTQVRLAMLLAIGLMGAGTVATFLGKGVITAAYGQAYQDAARILPAMMLAGIPWAITSLYLTEVRVMHRHVATVVITLTLDVGDHRARADPRAGTRTQTRLERGDQRLAGRQRVRRHRGHHRHLEWQETGPLTDPRGRPGHPPHRTQQPITA